MPSKKPASSRHAHRPAKRAAHSPAKASVTAKSAGQRTATGRTVQTKPGAGGQRYVIGVDLGGTNIVVGAMPLDGTREYGVRSEPTHSELGADSVVERIGRMIDDVIATTGTETGAARRDFIGVGIGAPGPLDREHGIVIVTPNLGWRDFPLRDRVSARVKLPATLDNDANCATVGEWWRGAAAGGRNVVGMTIGTGIGGGLILEGQLYHGSSDVAGEVGHTTIDPTGRRCKCGNYGCLEAYASGPAIAQRATEALAGGEASLLRELIQDDMSRMTARIVYDAATLGDPLAVEVVRETARFLGTGVANLLNIFNPDVVVLAGGVAAAGDALFEPLRAEVRRRAFRPAVEACRIVGGTLAGTAGVVGAVATFMMQTLGGIGPHEHPRHHE
ncbi:MAG: ROK family protein [Gemmatimonadales bacterium]|jgi:glucokinase